MCSYYSTNFKYHCRDLVLSDMHFENARVNGTSSNSFVQECLKGFNGAVNMFMTVGRKIQLLNENVFLHEREREREKQAS